MWVLERQDGILRQHGGQPGREGRTIVMAEPDTFENVIVLETGNFKSEDTSLPFQGCTK
jgi:hypothetical protein